MANDPREHGPMSEGQGYETRDANFTNLMKVALALLGLIAFGLIVSAGMLELSKQMTSSPGATPETLTAPAALPPAPRVQPDPHAELMKLRAAEDSVLLSYGWTNKDSGIARVPIERAMDLLLRRGLPARPGESDSGK